jgi:hypothetical protein
VGVVNHASGAVTSMSLTGSGIFGFDDDGLCLNGGGLTFSGNGYCATLPGGSSGYEGPTSHFTVTNTSAGTVTFSPGIPPNGTTFFGLEGAPASLSANIAVSTSATAVPTLSTFALVLTGLLIAGLGVRFLKFA